MAGFESLLKNQVQNVMKILGQNDGLAPNQVFVREDSTAYDTATRTYTSAETDYPDIPMVLAKFSAEEIDDDVVVTTDLKALIAALDMPTGVVPAMGDKIRTQAGEVYNVERIMGVPGESLYILHVRLTEP